jgi:hypothetical protein
MTDFSVRAPVLNNSIQSIQLGGDWSIFDQLKLPTLKSLHLHGGGYNGHQISGLIADSGCVIEFVHLEHFYSDQEALQCLEMIPTVVELKLSSLYLFPGNVLFAWLIDFPTFLPDLTNLEIDVAGHEWSNKTLVDMLWSRWHPDDSTAYGVLVLDEDHHHAQLLRFKLSCRIVLDDSDVLRVKTLMAEGMSISIDREGGWV